MVLFSSFLIFFFSFVKVDGSLGKKIWWRITPSEYQSQESKRKEKKKRIKEEGEGKIEEGAFPFSYYYYYHYSLILISFCSTIFLGFEWTKLSSSISFVMPLD